MFEFKLKGEEQTPKGWLIAKGCDQVPDIDFNHMFAPVAKVASTWLLAAIACALDWELECFDATHAFL